MLRFLLSVALTLTVFINLNASEPVHNLFSNSSESVQKFAELCYTFPADSLADLIYNYNDFPEPQGRDTLLTLTNTLNDSLEVPYHLYIPEQYNPQKKTPLVVWMHGGVSRPEFIEDASEWMDHPIVTTCSETGWLVLIPMGKVNVTWFDDLGMRNVMEQIRHLKMNYNIDDDRVVGCGFSDGGSGSFLFAMRTPTDFAVLFPWSGHPGVGGFVTNTPSYLTNLRNRTLFASNGGLDRLYPADALQPIMQLAIDDGADLNFTVYDTAGHNYGYMESEFKLFSQRVIDNPRHPFQPSLYWESAYMLHNRVDWLEITALDTSLEEAYWHEDINFNMKNDRLTIGFNHDQTYEGEGVKVAMLVDDPEVPAVQMGLSVGDIVVAMDNIPTPDISSLGAAKDSSARGQAFTLTVKRDDQQLVLQGAFPEVNYYKAFLRNRASGAVNVSRVGNDFYVRTSRIGGIRLYIHPEMVRLDQPVCVFVDGELRYDAMVKPDSKFMVDQFVLNRDRRSLWINAIDIRL
ncbi:dienelactone hydrolase family protein [Calditrichota bacterium]